MNRRMIVGLTVVCVLTASSAVRADPIPTNYQWGYRFVPDGSPYNLITNHNATGMVSIPENGGYNAMQSAAGATVQISTPVYEWSSASASNPQTVNNVPFSVNLKLTDRASGIKEFLSFCGLFNGSIWHTGSTLSPTFLSPLSQTINIDHHLYTVTFAGYTAPQGLSQPGSLRFDVSVHHNPEPSSLALAGIGVPLFGFFLRRRQRAACAAA